LGHRIALAVSHGAIRTSGGEGRSFFVGHVGQTVNHRACCAGSWPIPVHGGHSACPDEKIRPWARGLRIMRVKTIGHGRGGHPWWAQPLFIMIK
jgi:hypothetical protein